MLKYTERGVVVKRPGVLRKVQMLNLVLGVGVYSLRPTTTLEIQNIQVGSKLWLQDPKKFGVGVRSMAQKQKT